LLLRGQSVGDPARNEYLADPFLSHCDRPGLREIKQVELYTKWRTYVHLMYRDEICSKPTAKVLNRVKTDRADGAKERASQPKSGKRVVGGPLLEINRYVFSKGDHLVPFWKINGRFCACRTGSHDRPL
jgi:hypothetical protein